MKIKNISVAAILVVIIAVLLSANIYFLFFFDFSAEALPEKEAGENSVPNEDMKPTGITNGDYKPRIMPIPLPLDSQMDNHLKLFRQNAEALAVKYPNNFIFSAPTKEKVCALTFDDGPDKITTEMIIKILDHYNIKGTFFLIGNQISNSYSTVKKAVDKGNMVANHSWSHQRPTTGNTLDLLHEISLTNSKLAQMGIYTNYYRPPYGLVTEEQAARLSELNYRIIAWSVDSMDWYFNDPDKIYNCVVEAIHPGAIVLMHSAGGTDNRAAVIKALPNIIEKLKSDGYEFLTVDELLTLH